MSSVERNTLYRYPKLQVLFSLSSEKNPNAKSNVVLPRQHLLRWGGRALPHETDSRFSTVADGNE